MAPNLGFLQQLLDLERLIFTSKETTAKATTMAMGMSRQASDTPSRRAVAMSRQTSDTPPRRARAESLDSWAADEPIVIPSFSPQELLEISSFHPGERLVKGADDEKWKHLATTAARSTAESVNAPSTPRMIAPLTPSSKALPFNIFE